MTARAVPHSQTNEERSVNRIPLPVVQSKPEPVECTECGKCCTYVGVEIDEPTGAKDASDILWYLYHPGVYIYVDGNDEWSVHFESRCRNLDENLLCRVYEQRPDICRGFDPETCEVNDHENTAYTFRQPGEFLDWLRENRKKLYRKVEKRFLPPELRTEAETPTGKRKKGKKKRRKR
jgi:Fe-S-cluster containining protein